MNLSLHIRTFLRSLLRKIGLTKLIAKLILIIRGANYEEKFSSAFLKSVRPGDFIWDVGANVGFYTAQLSKLTGQNGNVWAFEPAPECCNRIANMGLSNVKVINAALGETTGQAKFTLSDNPLATTHSLVISPNSGEPNTIDIACWKGDDILQSEDLPVPNIIKIDVEGFEEEVLIGIESILRNPACRALFVEVHFAILDSRGRRNAPARIEKRFQDFGFKTHWIDSSHIAATKPN